MSRYYYLTGKPGCGKTRTLTELLPLLEAEPATFEVQGLLSPAVLENGRKVAIDLLDIAQADRKRLADLKGDQSRGPATKRWAFRQPTIDWGNERLAHMPRSRLFIIDELGPLEFQRQEGLLNALVKLDHAQFDIGLVVIRPALLEAAADRWPVDQVINLEGQSSPAETARGLADLIQSTIAGG